MAASARQISVVVDADSAPLQSAVAKAADALKALGDELAKQQKVALQGADQTIKANSSVADSYAKMSGSVRGSTLEIVKSIQSQIEADRVKSGEAAKTANAVKDAAAREADAYKLTGDVASAAAEKMAKAADVQMAAAEKMSSGAKRVGDSHSKGFASATSGVSGFAKKFAEAAVAVGVGSLYMSSKFEASTERLQTQAGATSKQVKAMRDDILASAGALGTTPEKFSDALYHVVSSMNKVLPEATRTNEELKITKIALEGAAVGGSDAAETAYALASSMNVLHDRAGDAGQVMGLLNAVVGTGDMTMSNLLEAMKSGLVPTAQTFGVSMQSVGAALAVMGDEGMRGALAGTRLRMSLSLLAAPAEKAAEYLHAIGMSGGEVRARTAAMTEALKEAGLTTTTMAADLKKPDGIGVALTDLNTHLRESGLSAEDASALISRAFGGGRMGSTIELLDQSTHRLAASNDQIGKGVKNFSSDWGEAKKTIEFSAKATEGSLSALADRIGLDLTPKAKEALGTLREVAEYFEKNREAAKALEIALATGLGVAVTAFTANKLAKMVEGLKTAASAFGKLSGLGSSGTAAGGGAKSAGGGALSGIYGVHGPQAPGSPANPIVVAVESGDVAGLGGNAAAAEAESSTGGSVVSKVLGADHPIATAGVVAAGLSGMAAAGKPGVEQTPGNDLNAFLHGADPTKVVTDAAKLAGITIPSISQLVLPSVKELGFDPDAEPAKTANALINGLPAKLTPPKTAQERQYEDKRSAGHAQATAVGGIGPNVPTNAEADGTRELVKARDELATSSARVAQAQEALNTQNQLGQRGTAEYARVVKELKEAEAEHTKALAAVAAATPGSDAAMAKTKDTLGIVRQAYASLAPALKKYVGDAKQAVGSELEAVAKQTGPLSLEATSHIISAYNTLPPKLKAELAKAGGEVKKGIEKINQETEVELKSLGVAGGIGSNALSGVTSLLGGESHRKAAKGGLFQLGRPGEAGKDTIPLNAGGIPIVAGAGEQVAVFTRHQQRVANQALAPMGGLPGLFSKVTTPNYMASGGVVVGGSNMSYGDEPRILGDLDKLAAELKKTVYVISGARSEAESAALGYPHDPHTEGKAADIGVGSPSRESMNAVSDAALRAVDLYRPFYPSMGEAEVNHVQLIGVPFGGGSGMPSGGAAGPAAIAKQLAQIAAPKVGGSGVVAQIAQAALNKVAAGANSVLGASASSSSGGGIGTGFSGAWTQVMAQIASRKHWNLGDWKQVVSLESGGNPRAVNPSSGAAGLGQALGATKTQFPKMVSPNASTQIEGMAEYIASRYGNPTAALAHEHAYHWYDQGGFVQAFSDGGPVATDASKSTKKPQHNKKIPNKHSKTPTHKRSLMQSLAAALAPLKLIPDTEKLPVDYELRAKALEDLQAQASLFQSLESASKQDTFILPGDMDYIGGMSKYANVQAGMTTQQALRINEAAVTRNKQASAGKATVPQEEEAEALSYQAEFINWASEQPSHRKLTASDVSILSGASKEVGWTPKVGTPLWEAELANIQVQLNQLGGEENSAKQGLSLVALAIAERHRREKQVQSVMDREDHRLKLTEKHIEGLKTGSLQQKVSEAESEANYKARVEAAEESSASIQESIDSEKAAARPDKKLIAQLEKHKEEVTKAAKEGKPASGKVGAAQIALLERELTTELPPIKQALSELGGKSTAVSHSGGEYGKLVGEIKTLTKAGTDTYESAINKIETNERPAAMLTERSIEEAAKDSPVPVFIAGSHEAATESGVLEGLQKELIQQLSEAKAIQGAELKTLTNFIPQIPHYQKGGPVLDDGLIYAHKGEHVVPVGGSLAINSSAPNVQTNVHVHGELAPLLRIIDERVQHPANVVGVSRQMARRGNLLRAR